MADTATATDSTLVDDAQRQHECTLRVMPPRSIDGFRTISVVGRGGMGIVYKAEQLSPCRLVALKVIGCGAHFDETHVRLFQREIRALGRLQHPGIASIFTAGLTEEGEHFFAMEYIDGVPLGRYMRSTNLTDEAKLSLFTEVCNAVHYAHENDVLHLDLKPSNILVLADGTPKIVDFGLARIVGVDRDSTLATSERRTPRGTYPYISPERLENASNIVDRRSDIYALGVILYELFTDGLEELSLGISSPTPARFSPSPESIRQVSQPLRLIISKALRHNPVNRYKSVGSLLADLRACKPSRNAHSSIKHNKVRISVALIACVTLLLLIASGWHDSIPISRQSDDGKAAKRTMQRDEAFDKNAILRFGPYPGMALNTLERLSDYINTTHQDSGMTQAEFLVEIGSAYLSLAQYSQATDYFTVAAHLQESALGPFHPALGETLHRLVLVRRWADDGPDVIAIYDRIIDIAEREYGPEDLRVAKLHQEKAHALFRIGDLKGSLDSVQEACRRIRNCPFHTTDDVARCILDVAGRFLALGKRREATAELEQIRKLCTGNAGQCDEILNLLIRSEESQIAEQMGEFGEMLNLRETNYNAAQNQLIEDPAIQAGFALTLARAYLDLDRPDEAERTLAEADALLKFLPERDPRIADVMGAIAGAHWTRGNYDQAENLMRRRLAILEQNGDALRTAEGRNGLGVVLRDRGHLEEAALLLEKALQATQAHLGDDHIYTSNRLINLARLGLTRNNFMAAKEFAVRSLRIREDFYPWSHPDIAEAKMVLGMIYAEIGHTEQGLGLAREALSLFEYTFSDTHYRVVEARLAVARCLLQSGNFGTAPVMIDQARRTIESRLASTHKLRGQLDSLVCGIGALASP